MYQPPHFREDRLDVQHAFMRAHPFALLVTMGQGGLTANAVPLVLDPQAGPLGTLRGHLARANGQWRSFDPAAECLVVFQGADAYVTPAWYATKRETGKVVPTWNYAMVQAYGRLAVRDDPAWLRAQVDALTGQHEAGRAEPWETGDAPEPFIAAQLKGIVGVEIAITRIEGKWKASQNRNAADIDGVIAGLEGEGTLRAAEMAGVVSERRR